MRRKDHSTFQNMNTNFTWTTTERGEKAILYNNYLYRFKRENRNGSVR